MNGYELSRIWYDFAFENPDLVSGNHAAVYLWQVELNNRMGWAKKFASPASQSMSASGIKSYNTYKKVMADLVAWGFIEIITESKNQNTAHIIALSIFDEALDKALDKAMTKQSTKHLTKRVESTVQSTSSIIKQENKEPLNQETINQEKESVEKNFDSGFVEVEAEEVLNSSSELKIVKPPKVAKKGSAKPVEACTLTHQIRQEVEARHPGYEWSGKEGKAAKTLSLEISKRLKKRHGREISDEEVITNTVWLFDNLPEFYKSKFDLSMIAGKLNSIMVEITENLKNGKSKGGGQNVDGADLARKAIEYANEVRAYGRKNE